MKKITMYLLIVFVFIGIISISSVYVNADTVYYNEYETDYWTNFDLSRVDASYNQVEGTFIGYNNTMLNVPQTLDYIDLKCGYNSDGIRITMDFMDANLVVHDRLSFLYPDFSDDSIGYVTFIYENDTFRKIVIPYGLNLKYYFFNEGAKYFSVINPEPNIKVKSLRFEFEFDLSKISDEYVNFFFDRVGNVEVDSDFYLDYRLISDLYTEGYNKGKIDGINEGYNNGLIKGYDNGYTQGNIDGFNDGYQNALEASYQDVYDEGYAKGQEDRFMSGFEKWIVPAIISILFVSGFFAFRGLRKRHEE